MNELMNVKVKKGVESTGKVNCASIPIVEHIQPLGTLSLMAWKIVTIHSVEKVIYMKIRCEHENKLFLQKLGDGYAPDHRIEDY